MTLQDSYIMGKLRDATTYEPISGAYLVDLNGLTLLGVSDDYGDFTIASPAGEYAEIGIQALGYVDRIIPVFFPKYATTKIVLQYMQAGRWGSHIPLG